MSNLLFLVVFITIIIVGMPILHYVYNAIWNYLERKANTGRVANERTFLI